eukprot:gene28002-36882_t
MPNTEPGMITLNANRNTDTSSTASNPTASSQVPETEKKGRFLIKNVKGTGITSTSSPSVQTAAPVATVSINSNTFPLTQQLAIASNLSNPSNTSSTIEDRNVGTKTLEISPQTNDSRDMNVSQSNYSSASSSGPAVGHPLPFPAIAAASPKANCAVNIVASEDNTAMNSTAVNQNSTDSSSNNSHTSADITASTAKKKISRFIVKSVPKEEEEGRLPDPPVGPKLSAPPRAVVGPTAGATAPTGETSAEMYNALNSRLEQLLTLNTQIMDYIASDSFRKLPSSEIVKGSGTQDSYLQVSRSASDHDGNAITAHQAASLPKIPSSSTISLLVPGTKGIAMTDPLPSPAQRSLTLDVSHIRSGGPSSAASPAAPSSSATEKRESASSLPATSPLTAPSAKDREKSAMLSSISNAMMGSSSSGSGASALSEEKDKDNSMAKLSHYLLEMKKELDVAQKQRREKQLETQRLREKCQQLEDQLKAEQSKTQQQSERQKKLQLLLDERNASLSAQALKIEQLQAALAASKAAATPASSEAPSATVTPTVLDAAIKLRSSDSGGGGIL